MGVEIGVELIEKGHLLTEGGFVGDLGPPHAEEGSVVERGELPGKSGRMGSDFKEEVELGIRGVGWGDIQGLCVLDDVEEKLGCDGIGERGRNGVGEVGERGDGGGREVEGEVEENTIRQDGGKRMENE